MLDLKDDLTSRATYASGNFAALNQEIGDAFGPRLVRSGPLGDVGELRGHVLVLLSFIVSARQAGVSARGWDFDSASLATDPLANFPATNTPNAAWYQTLLSQASAVA